MLQLELLRAPFGICQEAREEERLQQEAKGFSWFYHVLPLEFRV